MPSEYLTTKELAELLRIKERKVYDLAASGEIPCSKALGKLLFPRQAINAWLGENATGYLPKVEITRPDIFLGSHDPLLDWALREAQINIATIFDSSLDGLDRFTRNEGIATGLHIYSATHDSWNTNHIEDDFSGRDVVLIEWAKRTRGLLLPPGKAATIRSITDLKGLTLARRQKTAGSQILFEILRKRAGLGDEEIGHGPICRTESDAALAVNEGSADVAFGLEAQAGHFGLDFVPLIVERFDLLIDRHAYFEPPIQALLQFCKSKEFAQKAASMRGYDVGGLGRVRFNA